MATAALLPSDAAAQLFRRRARGGIQLGIDRLQVDGFAALRGKRVGLVTNQSGVSAGGTKTRLILHKAKGVDLRALFTPEHGLDGDEPAGKWVASRRDSATGLTAFSLYGKSRKPSAASLRGLDVLVFDIQDVGTRMYTYISTMGLCMEAAAQAGIEFMVLDRPNPLGGRRVEGPPLASGWKSFVGQFPIPQVHGLTTGELAKMIAAKGWMAARPKLSVVPMAGWNRAMDWRATGLRWVRTSPNIPRAESCAFYAATGIAQHVPGIDAGTGTATPFEYVTAKGLDGRKMASIMTAQRWSGVSFSPYRSRKRSGYEGVSLKLDPAKVPNLMALDLGLLATFYAESKRQGIDLIASASASERSLLYKVYGSDALATALRQGKNGQQIAAGWAGGVAAFVRQRAPYLLYR